MLAAMANSQAISSVFVYGSLMADDVVRVLLNRVPPSSPATLHNFHRFSIKGRVYPAIVPVENKKVDGRVLQGITLPEMDILDNFEDVEYERRTVDVTLMDVEYERRTVDVTLMDSSQILQADAYVWVDKNDPNLYGEWNFEEWKILHMKDFMKMTMGFMEELEQPDSKTRVATYESFYNQEGKN